MYAHIDWISFSLVIGEGEGRMSHHMPGIIRDALDSLSPTLVEDLGLLGEVEPRSGRKPYSLSWHAIQTKVTVYAHPHLPHALVEISGQATEALYALGTMPRVLEAVKNRVTRLDLAVDMETPTRPADFAGVRDVARFKSQGHQVSESGETFYVGSRTSDRYARVYRYNPPHERAHLLRCEMVLRDQNAKAGARDILEMGEERYAAMLGNVFGWGHPDWKPAEATTDKPVAYRPERREGKTLYWLADTIAPLLVRLHQEGAIDVDQWFADHIAPKLHQDTPTKDQP